MGFNNLQMPDTPWHIGYTKKKENDPRRHKARCIHYKNSLCGCSKSSSYNILCQGSAHCKYYFESYFEWKKYVNEMKTVDDLRQESADKRALTNRQIKQKMALEEMKNHKRLGNVKLGNCRSCPICCEKLKQGWCKYCGFSVAKFNNNL